MTDFVTPARPSTRSLLTLDRLGPSFGAEVIGLDVRAATDAQVAAIRDALVTYKVLFFRGQDLTDDDQVELGRRIGDLTAAHPVVGGVDAAHPEVYSIDSADPEFSFSDVWHTDVTFMERPPLGSLLRAVELPPYGGDTSWVDSQLAYESLAAPVRQLVDQLTAVHDGNREWGHYLKRRGNRATSGTASRSPSWSRSSTRWCACTRRPAARGCSSTPGSPRTSSASPTRRAAASSTCCTRTSPSPSTPSGTAGRSATSASGTTAAPRTTPTATTPRRA